MGLAAAVVIAAAAAVLLGAAADAALVAAAAEQDEQDDDPQTVVAAEAVVIHRITSGIGIWSGFAAHSMLFRRPDLVTIVGNGLRAVPHRPQQKRNGT